MLRHFVKNGVPAALLSLLIMMLAGCASLPGIHTAETTAAPDKASREFVRITKLMEEGNLRNAELKLLQFAYDYPTFAGPYINLGIIYMKTDRP